MQSSGEPHILRDTRTDDAPHYDLRRLIQAADVGISLCRLVRDDRGEPFDYCIDEVNAAFERHSGLRAADSVGRLRSALNPVRDEAMFETILRVVETGQADSVEQHNLGLSRWFSVDLVPLGDDGFAQLFTDITDRKRREAHVVFLTDLTDAWSTADTESEMISILGERLGERLLADTVLFMTVDDDARSAKVTSAWSNGSAPDLGAAFRLTEYLTEEFEEAARAGRTVAISDTRTDGRARPEAFEALNVRSLVTVPFRRSGRWRSQLTVCASEAREWEEADVRLVEEAASRAFPRLEHAQAVEALQDRERRLAILNEANALLLVGESPERAVQAIGESVMQHLGADVFFNYVLDQGAQRLRLNACGGVSTRVAKMIERLELGEAICGCVARDGVRIISEDVQHNGDPRADLVRRMGVRCYVCHPIRVTDTTVGTLSFGTKSKDAFSADEIDFMRAVTAEVSVAIEKDRLLQAQRSRRKRIEALHDILEVGLSSPRDRRAAQHILDRLPADHDFDLSSVWLADGDVLERVAAIGYPAGWDSNLPISGSDDISQVFRSGRRIVLRAPDDAARLEFYRGTATTPLACVVLPLQARGRHIGAITLAWTAEHELNEYDLAFLDSIADEIAVVLENSRLYEAEHTIAETLQSTLVDLPPRLPEVEFSRAYKSSTYQMGRVGGDFVDLFQVSPHLVGIVVGDVSGKGIRAAAVTSLVRNAVRAHAIDGLPPARVIEKTNNVVRRFTQVEDFVTMFFGLLDTRTGRLRYVSAGHPASLIQSAGGVTEELTVRDPIVGAYDGVQFHETCVDMRKGDRLVLYTDGVTEARSAKGGEFLQLAGFRARLARHARMKTEKLANALMAEVVRFSDGVLRDDAAILVVEPTNLDDAASDRANLLK